MTESTAFNILWEFDSEGLWAVQGDSLDWYSFVFEECYAPAIIDQVFAPNPFLARLEEKRLADLAQQKCDAAGRALIERVYCSDAREPPRV